MKSSLTFYVRDFDKALEVYESFLGESAHYVDEMWAVFETEALKITLINFPVVKLLESMGRGHLMHSDSILPHAQVRSEEEEKSFDVVNETAHVESQSHDRIWLH